MQYKGGRLACVDGPLVEYVKEAFTFLAPRLNAYIYRDTSMTNPTLIVT